MSFDLIKKFKNKQALSKLKSRDKEAFIKAYDENAEEIHRFVYFKVGNREEADDLTSMIFLKCWHHIQNKTLEDANTLRALLYKIARTSIVDYYRANSGRPAASLDDEENKIEIMDDSEDPRDRLDREREIELIRRQLPLLKEEYREIIIMKFVNDLSLDEIADVSGKSKGSIKVMIHRALSALKEMVEKNLAESSGSPAPGEIGKAAVKPRRSRKMTG
ncbi:MAG: sigma-70 family RNA polymerase sigma factor [Patescibacteria group bacterium]|jgi:RNA polymerase sigma-70 factor (ECF subfamily)